MRQYTLNNHFRYGWDGEWFNSPDKHRKDFRIEYGRVSSAVGSFRAECVRAAQLMGQTTKEPIVIALSGGIDSEVIARSFLEAKIPFRAAIVRFAADINKKDIAYAIAFCQKHHVEHFFVDLDLMNFWNRQIFAYAEMYGGTSSHRPLMMHLIDHVEGYIIVGGGDFRLQRDEGSDLIYFGQYHDSTILQRFLADKGRAGCPRFFMYTPELMQSFLEDPLVQSWMKCARAMRMMTIKNFKPMIFNRLWPEMPLRPKLHGFELLEPFDMKLREELRRRASYQPEKDEIRIGADEMLAALNAEEPVIFTAGRKLTGASFPPR